MVSLKGSTSRNIDTCQLQVSEFPPSEILPYRRSNRRVVSDRVFEHRRRVGHAASGGKRGLETIASDQCSDRKKRLLICIGMYLVFLTA